ncbi:hypothetical protein [Sphingomonas sp. G-3-2-10]|uniref:hypothetical protein n=1 Tax=Sphingomonas sp. G-3-2-10 TaxID=2728838 RepID=UPI00146AFEBA|nr:hypothetical protein [Sphingomonas sp. G-3-2-10]NML06861.1 hypothetical protein [Sphingomonas sp. G-3-2-10]
MKTLPLILYSLALAAFYNGSLAVLHANGIQGWSAILLSLVAGTAFAAVILGIMNARERKRRDR